MRGARAHGGLRVQITLDRETVDPFAGGLANPAERLWRAVESDPA